MSRTLVLKIAYVIAVVVLGGAAFLVIRSVGGGIFAFAVVGVLLLIPGRIHGVVHRDLFRGRRLCEVGEFELSIKHSRRFLALVRAQPWRKSLMWVAWSVYTPDAEAMALNNIGAAQLELGRFDEAAASFRSAIAVDLLYPIPHYNLAVERSIAGDHVEAERFAAEAVRLGYTGGGADRAIGQAGSLLARLEGRGVAKSRR